MPARVLQTAALALLTAAAASAADLSDAALHDISDEQYYQMPRLFQLDEYDECLAARGVYCVGSFELTTDDPHHRVYQLMQKYSSNWVDHFNHTRLHRGLCVSRRCPAPPPAPADQPAPEPLHAWFASCVNESTISSHKLSARLYRLDYCERGAGAGAGAGAGGEPLSASERALAGLGAALLALAFLSTGLDLTLPDHTKKSLSWALAWSVRGGWRSLLAAPAGDGVDLAALDGLRVLGMLCFIVEHVCWLNAITYIVNPRWLEQNRRETDAMLVSNSTLLVQAFFIMSAFLLAHKLLQQRRRNEPLRPLRTFVETMLNRVIRYGSFRRRTFGRKVLTILLLDAMLVSNSTLLVQAFFLMSSFLLAHKLLQQRRRNEPLRTFVETMLNRVIRYGSFRRRTFGRKVLTILLLDAMLVSNSTLLVQAFFLMSSFLLAHKLLQQRRRNEPLRPLRTFVETMLNRVIRMSPTYLVVVWFAASGWARAGGGPLWAPLVRGESAVCRHKWWAHVLYLNNVLYPDDKCLIQTWYLAADMQLYCCALLLTLAMWRLRRGALVALGALLAGCVLLVFALAYAWALVPTYVLHRPEAVRALYRGEASFNVVYQSPLGNAPGALAGLLLAHAHHALSESGVKLCERAWFRWAAWWAPWLAAGWVALSARLAGMGGRAADAALAALERPVFALLVAVALLGAMHGVKSPVRSFLSWRGWAVLARLSFGALLLHMIINKSLLASQMAPTQLNRITVILEWFGVAVASYLAALPLALLVEIPVQRLYRALRPPAPRAPAPPPPAPSKADM